MYCHVDWCLRLCTKRAELWADRTAVGICGPRWNGKRNAGASCGTVQEEFQVVRSGKRELDCGCVGPAAGIVEVVHDRGF